MLHNEHLRKADESYEIRHDHSGNVIHVYIKDGEAVLFPTLIEMIRWLLFGSQEERFYMNEEDLERLYEHDEYNYYKLKKIADEKSYITSRVFLNQVTSPRQ